MSFIRLNPVTAKVLRALVYFYEKNGDFAYVPFGPIVRKTGVEVRAVRRACRYLARRGLAEFQKGLVNEDGFFAGAGYCATKKGVDAVFPYRKAVVCSECGGSGHTYGYGSTDPSEKAQHVTCSVCNGEGGYYKDVDIHDI